MDILFIRHGETDGNKARRHQHPDTALNPRGEEQVAQVLAYVEAFRPTHLVTSTNLRAVQTARAVALATDLVPETSALFEELRRPNYLYGHRFVGRTTLVYILRWFYGGAVEDGETYAQFVSRLAAARQYLETLPSEARVVVVSHSVFINLFIEHRCGREGLNFFQAAVRFARILLHKNTGLSLLRYTPESHTCGWELIATRTALQPEP